MNKNNFTETSNCKKKKINKKIDHYNNNLKNLSNSIACKL